MAEVTPTVKLFYNSQVI